MNIITWIAIVLSFAVPITISLFNLEHKESTLVIVEFVAQIATLGMLGTFLKNVSSKAEIGKKHFIQIYCCL